MRRAAWSDRRRALPPRDAMRFLSDAHRCLARARPPVRPKALAISDAFMTTVYLALSKIANATRRTVEPGRGSHAARWRSAGPKRACTFLLPTFYATTRQRI